MPTSSPYYLDIGVNFSIKERVKVQNTKKRTATPKYISNYHIFQNHPISRIPKPSEYIGLSILKEQVRFPQQCWGLPDCLGTCNIHAIKLSSTFFSYLHCNHDERLKNQCYLVLFEYIEVQT
jgi:hypothetical protein